MFGVEYMRTRGARNMQVAGVGVARHLDSSARIVWSQTHVPTIQIYALSCLYIQDLRLV